MKQSEQKSTSSTSKAAKRRVSSTAANTPTRKLSIDVKTVKVVGLPSAPPPKNLPSLDQFLSSIRPTLKPSSPVWRHAEAIRLYDIMRAEAALFGSGRERRTTTAEAMERLKVIYPGVFE